MILFLPPFFNHCIFFKNIFSADLHFNHRFILCWPLATFLAKMDQFMMTIMAIILKNGHYGHHGTNHLVINVAKGIHLMNLWIKCRSAVKRALKYRASAKGAFAKGPFLQREPIHHTRFSTGPIHCTCIFDLKKIICF